MSTQCVALIECCTFSICSSDVSKSMWGKHKSGTEVDSNLPVAGLQQSCGEAITLSPLTSNASGTQSVRGSSIAITAEHQVLLNRIPHVMDLQCTRSLILPNYTREFATQHDEDVRHCLGRLLGVVFLDAAWNLATLPLNLGAYSRKTDLVICCPSPSPSHVCVKASRGRNAFTPTRLMPTFGVSVGLLTAGDVWLEGRLKPQR